MDITRPASYRTDTWPQVIGPLQAMSAPELRKLADRAGIATDQEPATLIEQLLSRGGFLLVELGLINDPQIMNGTLFSLGGLEYVINSAGARLLQTKTGTARIPVIGGGKSRTFNYNQLMKALVESPDFDQLTPRQ